MSIEPLGFEIGRSLAQGGLVHIDAKDLCIHGSIGGSELAQPSCCCTQEDAVSAGRVEHTGAGASRQRPAGEKVSDRRWGKKRSPRLAIVLDLYNGQRR